jgi:hypothetical protein
LVSLSSARRHASISSVRGRKVLDKVINTELLSHPLNWVIILLMVMIFGIGLHLVLDYYNISPGK